MDGLFWSVFLLLLALCSDIDVSYLLCVLFLVCSPIGLFSLL